MLFEKQYEFYRKKYIEHMRKQSGGFMPYPIGVNSDYTNSPISTVVNVIRKQFKSINSVEFTTECPCAYDCIKFSFDNNVDALEFARTSNAKHINKDVYWGYGKASYGFTRMNIPTFGIDKIAMFDAIKNYPFNYKISHNIANINIKYNSDVTTVKINNGSNSDNISGGHERNIDEIIGAGIIPVDIVDNKLILLLGKNPFSYSKPKNKLYNIPELNKKVLMCDKCYTFFGGSVDKSDLSARQNAYREACEESCPHDYERDKEKNNPLLIKPISILPLDEIKEKLENGKCLCIPKYVDGKWNNMYFVKINSRDWCKRNNGYSIDIPNNMIYNNEVVKVKWLEARKILEFKDTDGAFLSMFVPLVTVLKNHIDDMESYFKTN